MKGYKYHSPINLFSPNLDRLAIREALYFFGGEKVPPPRQKSRATAYVMRRPGSLDQHQRLLRQLVLFVNLQLCLPYIYLILFLVSYKYIMYYLYVSGIYVYLDVLRIN